MNGFNVNQIVKGKAAGVFVILAVRNVGGESGYQVKEVNPADYSQHGRGEFFIPAECVEAVN